MKSSIKLTKIQIHKYKSFSTEQEISIEEDVTVLVGMNESGKTAALEAIAKTNYFQKDDLFKFNSTLDYPRKEKKNLDKSGINAKAITCFYEIGNPLKVKIENELGKGFLQDSSFSVTTYYDGTSSWTIKPLKAIDFIEKKTKELEISSNTLNEKLLKVKNREGLEIIKQEYSDPKYLVGIGSLMKYFENKSNWEDDPLGEYIVRNYLKPVLPKFLYYDEYYALPARISIEKLNGSNENEFKTARALFELADINTDELLGSDNFEDFIAELEATEAIISDELFKYWKTNKNLQITFQIDKIESSSNYSRTIIEHVLDIRVKHKGVSLSLKNRSKGFNWFFSFLVWFKKIQEDANSNYILLLDEPGLNLHASAQNDLLRFLNDLSKDYQIIYSTHSPFMITSDKLQKVRTVFETPEGSILSESIQEKDPDTLFPLQAALGYDIAQNLFIGKNNLLVEGVSDLIILTNMSGILESAGKNFLRHDITITPTGGLEKVATFISLLRGSKLEIACLLDSYNDSKGLEKMKNLIKEKIVRESKIRFYNEFIPEYKEADLEDLFTKEDYLKIFNAAFQEFRDIDIKDLNPKIERMIMQINTFLNIDRFNHYRPSNQLSKMGLTVEDFQEQTINNFEKLFMMVNSMFIES